ncbi:hypothetical protein, partial [Thiolapillus sp.]|uniref:hypothetical protein n=1 Tax=Thiolapillus sp. TaxID=2017437 RepID=UPI003AF70A27
GLVDICISIFTHGLPLDGNNWPGFKASRPKTHRTAIPGSLQHTTAMDGGSAGNAWSVPAIPSLEIAAPPSLAPCGIHSIPGNKKAPRGRPLAGTGCSAQRA